MPGFPASTTAPCSRAETPHRGPDAATPCAGRRAKAAVLAGPHLLSAAPLPGALGQADAARAVDRRPAAPPPAPRGPGHGAQTRVPPQAADDRDPGRGRRPQERPLGVETVDDHAHG